MNVFDFSFSLDDNFKQHMLQGTNEAYECETTWCSDLAIALWFEPFEPGAIKRTVEECKECWPHDFTHILEITSALNYLCWFCYETEQFSGFKKYWEVFSGLYYEMKEFAYTNLTEEEIIRLEHILN